MNNLTKIPHKKLSKLLIETDDMAILEEIARRIKFGLIPLAMVGFSKLSNRKLKRLETLTNCDWATEELCKRMDDGRIPTRVVTIEEMDTLDLARAALHNSHVPYSKEKYGVALLTENINEKYSACTLDSSSFGCSVEPLKAVFGAYAASGSIKNQKNKIKAIVFAFPFVKYPPGDALQLISDYCEPKTKIIIDNMGVTTVEELLPWAFKL